MEISEKLAQAAITKEKLKCPRPGAHSAKCTCKGTRWVTVCDGCGGSGWNGKLQKVCGTCAGTGCVTAVKA